MNTNRRGSSSLRGGRFRGGPLDAKSRWLMLLAVVTLSGFAAASASASPDASLKEIMKKMQAQLLNRDAKGLTTTFDLTKKKTKAEYPNWDAISDKGRAAVARGDFDGAKATCKECHDAYRNDYKTKYGSKAP